MRVPSRSPGIDRAVRSADAPSRTPAFLALLPLAAVATSCEVALKLNGLEGGCPPLRGASQVKVSSAGASYCIDSTEATNGQYAQFLSSGFALTGSAIPDGCAAGTSNTPDKNWPPDPGSDSFPVSYANWCQATAYCRWAGKRLCGTIGGGALAAVNFKDASLSQWLGACSGGGSLTYPYGQTFNPAACAGSSLSLVATHPACVGAVAGLYDMTGNVWEWTDTCASADPQAFCYTMGGAFDSAPSELTCLSERNWTRTASARDIGIRCCLDL